MRGTVIVVALLVPAALLLSCASTPAHRDTLSEPRLEYTVRLRETGPGAVVEVTLRASGLDDPTLFCLPAGTTAVTLDAPLIEALRVVSPPTACLQQIDDPYLWVLRGGSEVTLSWQVPHRFRELAVIREHDDEHEFPYVAEDHALLSASTLFLAPVHSRGGAVRFDLPEGWPIRAGWSELQGVHHPRGRELQDDYIAVGTWVERKVRVEQFEAHLVFAPSMLDLVEPISAVCAPVFTAAFEMFGREPAGRYLIAFGSPQENRLAGSPKASSITMSADPGLLQVAPEWLEEGIVHIVAHEFHHTWISHQPSLPEELRWYREGFTEYAAWLICTRLGVLDLEGWRRKLSEFLTEVDGMALREAQSLAAAGSSPELEQSRFVLCGGFLVALWLDLALRESGAADGLDGWMRSFNNDPQRRERAPTLDEFVDAVEAVLGATTAATLQRMVATSGGLEPSRLRADLGIDAVGDAPLPAGRWDQPVRRTTVTATVPDGGGRPTR